MTADLVAALAGLALLDSLNASTLFLVMVVLLTARRPVRSAICYLIGAASMFLGLSIGLYLGASAAEALITDLARWLRRVTFGLLAVWLLWLGIKRLRDRPRKPLTLPGWFGPLTAVPIGAAATIADLPNAFPLFLAVERLTSSSVGATTAVLLLCGYVALYALPIAVAIALGAWRGRSARAVMRRITDRFLSGTARRSLPLAVGFMAAAGASVGVAVVV